MALAQSGLDRILTLELVRVAEAAAVAAARLRGRGDEKEADQVLDGAASLDLPSAGSLRPTTLRWALLHMVEETARHAGHMDITRELLDGRVGR